MEHASGSAAVGMIDFNRSFITWTIDWAEPDPVYAYPGGFVGEPGEATTSRVQIDAGCEIVDEARGETCTLYLTAPCRSEFIIAKDNLFQVPNGEFRAAVSDACMVPIAAEPSWQDEGTRRQPIESRFADFDIDVRTHEAVALASSDEVVAASLAGDRLNARSTYRDAARGLAVTVEYPIKLINLHAGGGRYQVCTGAVALPDLTTWDGAGVDRVFVAHAAFTAADHVEFILRRSIELAEHELAWAAAVRGRDRYQRRTSPGEQRRIGRAPGPPATTRPGSWRQTTPSCGPLERCAGDRLRALALHLGRPAPPAGPVLPLSRRFRGRTRRRLPGAHWLRRRVHDPGESGTCRRWRSSCFSPVSPNTPSPTGTCSRSPARSSGVAISRTHGIPIAARPSTECEATAPSPHAGRYAGTHFTTQVVPDAQPVRDAAALIGAVRAQRILNARTSYRDEARGLTVTLEFPIRTINIEPTKRLFQVDAGPLPLPDLETWDGAMVSRVFLAHAAFSDWDRTEFILRREVEPLATEDWWWEVRGRDRRALHDPPRAPGDPPAPLPRRPPTLYNETLAMPARIEILIAPGRLAVRAACVVRRAGSGPCPGATIPAPADARSWRLGPARRFCGSPCLRSPSRRMGEIQVLGLGPVLSPVQDEPRSTDARQRGVSPCD